MQVIGFNLTKVLGERKPEIKLGNIDHSFEFINIEKEKLNILKDNEALKISFKYGITYKDSEKKEEKHGEISFEGNIITVVTKDEMKNIQKDWKSKKISPDLRTGLSNLVLRKCSGKAALLTDDLGLPPHIPIPLIQNKKED